MLQTIMNKQNELQKRLGTDFTQLNDEERAEFMRNHRGYLEDEIAEALYEMPFYKKWKDYSGMTDIDRALAWDKVKLELVDALHFFVNLLLAAGFTAEEVLDMYLAKNSENHRRQDEGYTADVSYREQSVEEVMAHRGTAADMPNKCIVEVDGEGHVSDRYVAVLGEYIFYNTDLVSLLKASRLCTKVLYNELNKLPAEEKAEFERFMYEVTDNE